MRGKFVIKQGKKGFQFKLLASNGKVIATSDPYPTRRNCLLGIESVRKTAPQATILEGPTAAPRAAAKTAPAASNGARRTKATAASAKTPAKAATKTAAPAKRTRATKATAAK